MNQYEAMFLFDPTFGTDFGNVKAEIERIMKRAEGEIVFCEKWEERKLAYEIQGRKRGLYVLTYFKAPGDKIAGIERDARLSESILRILVRRADDLAREDMERFMPQARSSSEDESDSGDERRPQRNTAPERKPAPSATAVAEKPSSAEAQPEKPAAESESNTEEDKPAE